MRKRLLQCLWFLVASFVLAILSQVPSATAKSASPPAQSTTKPSSQDISGAVTQSYNADPSVQIGMVVQLKTKDPTTVVPLDPSQIHNMLGVVVPSNNATIVLTPQQITKQQVLVTTNGHFTILVSNQNGPIKVGDYLTISAVAGIGMKASQDQEEVVGKASGNFTGTAGVIGSVDLKDTLGRKKTVAISRIPIDITVSHNPLYQKTADYVPGFLNKVATNVANKPVSVARIYISTALLFVISLVTGNMLYSGVRSGMLAIGRNPLSKKSILKSLLETIIAGLIVFIAGVFGVYLLLKL